MATFIKVEEPKEAWQELRKLMTAHYHASHLPKEPFVKEYPELYRLYLQISAHKEEFQLEE